MTLINDKNDSNIYRFLFVRHAESLSNQLGMISGSGDDCPLTDVGRDQAHILGKKIKEYSKESPTEIFCSPLIRAKETAEIINQYLGLPIISHAAFTEQHFGDWEGRKEWHSASKNFEQRADPENGEAYKDLYNRVYGGLQNVHQLSKMPIIVSHGGVWHAFKALVADFTTEWPPNASLYRAQLSKDSGFKSNKLFPATEE